MTKLSKSYKSSLTIKTVGWLKNLHSFCWHNSTIITLTAKLHQNGEKYCWNNLNEKSYVFVSSFGVMAEKMHRYCNFHSFVLRICHLLQKGENSKMYLSMVFAIYLGLVQVLSKTYKYLTLIVGENIFHYFECDLVAGSIIFRLWDETCVQFFLLKRLYVDY